MSDFSPLNNPIWHALTEAHAGWALKNGSAVRYPNSISALIGLETPDENAFSNLEALVGIGEQIGMFTSYRFSAPSHWELVRERDIDQMVCTETSSDADVSDLFLSRADVDDMLRLTRETEPGPFLPDTIDMGTYIGLRSDEGELVAMAGTRLSLSEFTEISAVCTTPRYRGRGLSKKLVAALVSKISAKGKTPFLHVKNEIDARFLYEKLGFKVHQSIRLSVFKRLS